MRVVLDTNVVVSAYLSPTGAPAGVFKKWEQHAFSVLVSEPILTEYERVFGYAKLRKIHRLSSEDIAALIDNFRSLAHLVEPETSLELIADLSDNKFLECALAGGASFIISGDAHLLNLGTFDGIPILTASAFLSVLEHEGR
jgi:uncharacterized protein